MKLVGADVVEVSPPFDATGGTALAAANIAFEILCLMRPALKQSPQSGTSGFEVGYFIGALVRAVIGWA